MRLLACSLCTLRRVHTRFRDYMCLVRWCGARSRCMVHVDTEQSIHTGSFARSFVPGSRLGRSTARSLSYSLARPHVPRLHARGALSVCIKEGARCRGLAFFWRGDATAAQPKPTPRCVNTRRNRLARRSHWVLHAPPKCANVYNGLNSKVTGRRKSACTGA